MKEPSMRPLLTTAIAVVLALPAAGAAAQTAAPPDRGYLRAGGDVRVSVASFSGVAHPIDFAEAATVATTYGQQAAPGFEVAGGVRVWRRLAVGASVTRFTKTSGGAVTAQVPHPFFFNRPRPVSGEASGLGREETGIHVQATWIVPVRPRVSLAIAGGPSWFSLSQDVVTDVSVTQTYPYDTATFAGVVSARESRSAVGFNVGGDLGVFFSRYVGVGVGATFSHAHVSLPATSATSSAGVDTGGLHVDAGLRVRF
jgi:hypothetical protein